MYCEICPCSQYSHLASLLDMFYRINRQYDLLYKSVPCEV